MSKYNPAKSEWLLNVKINKQTLYIMNGNLVYTCYI